MTEIEVGKTYRFDSNSMDSTWKLWDGTACTVLRPLTEEEADLAETGPMWRIQFGDSKHTETDAFDDELYGPYREKIPLMNGNDAGVMIADLQYGGRTDVGDRKSQYFDFATIPGRTSFVKVALIEDKSGLAHSYWGYLLHVLNDVDETDGFFLRTDRLETDELAKLLDDLAYDVAHGRL